MVRRTYGVPGLLLAGVLLAFVAGCGGGSGGNNGGGSVKASEACGQSVSPADPTSMSLDEVRAKVSFPIKYPCDLPDGMSLYSIVAAAVNKPGTIDNVSLTFTGGGRPLLVIMQAQSYVQPFAAPIAPGVVDVDINGRPGKWVDETQKTGTRQLIMTWDDNNIHYYMESEWSPDTTQDMMLAAARSLQ